MGSSISPPRLQSFHSSQKYGWPIADETKQIGQKQAPVTV